MSSDPPKIAIITVNFNKSGRTQELLQSLQQVNMTGLDLELIVVDNCSSDASVEEINKKFPTVKVLVNKENLGFSEGNNIGIKYGLNQGADYFLLLNKVHMIPSQNQISLHNIQSVQLLYLYYISVI